MNLPNRFGIPVIIIILFRTRMKSNKEKEE